MTETSFNQNGDGKGANDTGAVHDFGSAASLELEEIPKPAIMTRQNAVLKTVGHSTHKACVDSDEDEGNVRLCA